MGLSFSCRGNSGGGGSKTLLQTLNQLPDLWANIDPHCIAHQFDSPLWAWRFWNLGSLGWRKLRAHWLQLKMAPTRNKFNLAETITCRRATQTNYPKFARACGRLLALISQSNGCFPQARFLRLTDHLSRPPAPLYLACRPLLRPPARSLARRQLMAVCC